MKKISVLMMFMAALITGCSEASSSEDVVKFAYEWEKAKFNRDYEEQQKFLYEEGSYEAYKNDKKIDSGLKYEDIRFEVYYDEELEKYIVFADFENPNGSNTVEDNVVIKKKDTEFKVDTDESNDVVRDEIKEEFEREACIHCK